MTVPFSVVPWSTLALGVSNSSAGMTTMSSSRATAIAATDAGLQELTVRLQPLDDAVERDVVAAGRTPAQGFATSAFGRRFDLQVVTLDADGEDFEVAVFRPAALRARLQVKGGAVPGADHVAGGEEAAEHGQALVRAAVLEGPVLVVDVGDDDAPSVDLDPFLVPVRQLFDGADGYEIQMIGTPA